MKIKNRFGIWILMIILVMSTLYTLNMVVTRSSSNITYGIKSAEVPDRSLLIVYVYKSPLSIVPEGNLVKMSGPFGTFKKEFELCKPECKMTVYPGRNFPNITIEKIPSGINVSWESNWIRPRK